MLVVGDVGVDSVVVVGLVVVVVFVVVVGLFDFVVELVVDVVVVVDWPKVQKKKRTLASPETFSSRHQTQAPSHGRSPSRRSQRNQSSPRFQTIHQWSG